MKKMNFKWLIAVAIGVGFSGMITQFFAYIPAGQRRFPQEEETKAAPAPTAETPAAPAPATTKVVPVVPAKPGVPALPAPGEESKAKVLALPAPGEEPKAKVLALPAPEGPKAEALASPALEEKLLPLPPEAVLPPEGDSVKDELAQLQKNAVWFVQNKQKDQALYDYGVRWFLHVHRLRALNDYHREQEAVIKIAKEVSDRMLRLQREAGEKLVVAELPPSSLLALPAPGEAAMKKLNDAVLAMDTEVEDAMKHKEGETVKKRFQELMSLHEKVVDLYSKQKDNAAAQQVLKNNANLILSECVRLKRDAAGAAKNDKGEKLSFEEEMNEINPIR